MASGSPSGTERPTAILFDGGGTLVLQDPGSMGRSLGMEVDPVAAHEAHYRTMAEFAARRLAGEDVGWDWWLERYFGRLGHPVPAEAGPAIHRGYGMWNLPLPGAREAIIALRLAGIRVGVVSNSDGSVEASLVEAGYSGLFELVVDSSLAGVAKPDPEIFRLALDRMGLAPEDVWYVGDSVYHDVGGARAAALAKVLLVDPLDLQPDTKERIASVAELPALLGLNPAR